MIPVSLQFYLILHWNASKWSKTILSIQGWKSIRHLGTVKKLFQMIPFKSNSVTVLERSLKKEKQGNVCTSTIDKRKDKTSLHS